MSISSLIALLKNGNLAVIPTDTLYGIVAIARNEKAVARLCHLRRKTPNKPFIILIDRISSIQDFDIRLTPKEKTFLKRVWPGKVSVILPCSAKRFSYLHLKTGALAFRFPKSGKLLALIRKTGPLVAPSANPEGKSPARTIKEAKYYFGDSVEMYVSSGKKMNGKPSTLISLLSIEPKIIREGAVKISI